MGKTGKIFKSVLPTSQVFTNSDPKFFILNLTSFFGEDPGKIYFFQTDI